MTTSALATPRPATGRRTLTLVVGLLMLIIGFFAPLPPKTRESR